MKINIQKIIKISLVILTIGILLNLPFVVYDFYGDLSRADVFEQLEIGMSREEAQRILAERHIWCELSDKGSVNTCHFSDYWRNYSISISSETEKIYQRTYRNRTRHSFFRMVLSSY